MLQGRDKPRAVHINLAHLSCRNCHALCADDTAKVQSLLEGAGRVAEPEFFPQPSCPFYDYPLGRLSPYGAPTTGSGAQS